jgi:hypothetical protein
MKRLVLIAALIAALIAGCGAVRTSMSIQRGGWWADAYGWACECGSKTFAVISRPAIGVYRVRCPECHKEWIVGR